MNFLVLEMYRDRWLVAVPAAVNIEIRNTAEQQHESNDANFAAEIVTQIV